MAFYRKKVKSPLREDKKMVTNAIHVRQAFASTRLPQVSRIVISSVALVILGILPVGGCSDSGNRTLPSPGTEIPRNEERGITGAVTLSPKDKPGIPSNEKAQTSFSSEIKEAHFEVQIGHNGHVLGAHLSPDGKCLYSASRTELKVWEVSTGRLVDTHEFGIAQGSQCYDIAFSSDGSRFVLGTKESTELRETCSEKLIRSFTGGTTVTKGARSYGNGAGAVAFSRDSKWVVSNKGCVWSADTGDIVCSLEGASDADRAYGINPLAFSPDGRYVVGVIDYSSVRLWDVSTGRLIRLFEIDQGPYTPTTIAVSSNGKWVISSSLWDGEVRLWDLTTGKVLPTCNARKYLGRSVAFSPDGQCAIAGGKDTKALGNDGTILLWDVASGRVIRRFGEHEPLFALYFTLDAKHVLSCGGSSVKLWDVASGRELRQFDGFTFRRTSAMAFGPDGNILVLGADNRNTKLLNVLTGEVVHRSAEPKGETPSSEDYEPPDPHVRSISFSHDGKQVLIAGGGILYSDLTFLFLADPTSGSYIRKFDSPMGSVAYAAFGGDGRHVVSFEDCRSPHTISYWNTSTGKELSSYDTTSRPLAFSPDGRYFLSNSDQQNKTARNTIQLHDTSTGQVVRVFDQVEGFANLSVFRPDGKQVVATYNRGKAQDGPVDVFQVDLATGEVVRTYEQQPNYVESLAFSPDGRRVLMSSQLTTKVYDCETGRQVASLGGDVGAVSKGTRPVVATSERGIVYMWDLSTYELLYTVVLDMVSGEYVTWIPEGYYHGSEFAARHMVHLVRGMETFGTDQFFDRFYNPAMVQAKVLGYVVDEPTLDAVLANSPPPFVEVVSPRTGSEGKLVDESGQFSQPGADIQVKVRTLDAGGGVKELRLYHNGKRLGDDARVGDAVVQDKITIQDYRVALVGGDNLITASAFSNEMIESRPFELVIPYGQPEEKPDLYFLTVGVNTYGNNEYNLRLAREDAESFGKDLPERAKSMFGSFHTKQLFDEEATKSGILGALAEIAQQARPQDVFAFYFAGHGVVLEDTKRFYLATHGVSKLSSAQEPGSLETEGITDQELKDALQRIRALKQVVFLDACHSGTADLVAQAMGASDEVVIKKLSRASGTWVFTAADKQQYALEQTDLGHGLFTYSLLKGIAGEADAGARDGYVKLSELETYVADTVQKMATKLNRDQHPKIYKGGDDFSIAVASSGMASAAKARVSK